MLCTRAPFVVLALVSVLASPAFAARVVERIAGKGVCGNGAAGNGGPALDACLGLPAGVAVDGSGTVYFAEVLRGAIRRVASTGTIAQLPVALSQPGAIALDGSGGLFVSTAGDARIHRIDLGTNALTHVAGNGSTSHCGDGGLATAACIGTPTALAVHSGMLYVADATNHRVRRIDLGTGVIATFAGNGTNLADDSCPALGDGSAASAACLSRPAGLAVDSGGNVFIADNGNHRIRRVLAATGVIGTHAGTGDSVPCDESNPASSACIPYPGLLAIDGGDALYVSEGVVLPPGLGGPAEEPTLFPGTALLVRITSAAAPAERLTGTLPCSGNPEGLTADADCSVLGSFGFTVDASGGRIVYSGGLANVVREIVEVPETPLPAIFRSGLVPPTPALSSGERRVDTIVRGEARALSKCYAKGVAAFVAGKTVGCDVALTPCASDANCPFGQTCSTGALSGFCECSANSECAAGHTCDRTRAVFPVLALCIQGCSVTTCATRATTVATEQLQRAGAPACAAHAVYNGPYVATWRNSLLWCDGTEPLAAEITGGNPGGFFPADKVTARATLKLGRFLDKLTGDARKCFERGVGAVVAGVADGVASCLAKAEDKFARGTQNLSGLPACVDVPALAALVLEQEGDRNGALYCE